MADLVEMVQLSPTMEEGLIVKWLKSVGDVVEAGDLLAEVETDKATMEMESFYDGVLLKIVVPEGEGAPVGTAIAVIGEEGEDPDAALAAAGESAAAEEEPAAPEPAAAPVAAAAPSPAPVAAEAPASGRLRASPVARKVAAAEGVDLYQIEGSGPQGRIILRDVEAAIEAQEAAPAAASASAAVVYRPGPIPLSEATPAPTERVPLTPMRRAIARRLTEAWEAPAFMLTRDLDVAALLELRAQVNGKLDSAGERISVNDFVLKAAAVALRDVPDMNVAFDDDGIIRYGQVDIGAAVAIEGGLITPVIRDAASLSIRAIAYQLRDLASRARAKRLTPDEYSGATFSVSNLGMFGVDHFTAVLNPPAAGILAVGTIRSEAVVNDADELVVGKRMSVTLTCDHRAVDGAVGATWLQRFAQLIESPIELLL